MKFNTPSIKHNERLTFSGIFNIQHSLFEITIFSRATQNANSPLFLQFTFTLSLTWRRKEVKYAYAVNSNSDAHPLVLRNSQAPISWSIEAPPTVFYKVHRRHVPEIDTSWKVAQSCTVGAICSHFNRSKTREKEEYVSSPVLLGQPLLSSPRTVRWFRLQSHCIGELGCARRSIHWKRSEASGEWVQRKRDISTG